ncbi:DNA cross-link repair protein pso2/snm1 [Sphaceloma murrayae]|uniref:DNA cross-link repair protein pso2/snm1 n=1 Tax=Sphaceloma murrayae TaxID=2082308 RepID=A0A2K1QL34_9PEZI|nr:DNA cross-link repair protein pso2/snm1 [Sphaceloma murrayae]
MAAVEKLPTIGRGSTTPRKGNSTSNGKAKGKPNGSILTFFKKAEDENEELFVRSKHGSASSQETTSLWFDKRSHGMEEPVGGHLDRYQEQGESVKRRKLDCTSESVGEGSGTDQASCANPVTEHAVNEPQGRSTSISKVVKLTGPFLEEDSDNGDDDEEVPKGGVTVGTTKVNQEQVSEVDDTTKPRPPETVPSPAPQTLHTRPSDAILATGGLGSEESTEDGTEELSPPSLKREQTSVALGGDFADFEDLGDFDEDMFEGGDEYVERRWMEEEARLEAEQAALDDQDDSTEDIATPGAGPGPAAACLETGDAPSVHVNNCLDGNPTPLPVQLNKPPDGSLKVEASKPADRFRKVPRAPKPGQANPFVLGEKPASGGSAFSRLMSGHAEDAAWADAAASERDSRGKPSYQRTCPFYKILPGFNICVDAFRYGAVEGCKAYFLSHFHSDHYIGLTSHWCHGPIYCSKVTANLVKQQLRVDPQYVIALDWEDKVEVPGSNGVSVTMISANHCPGSSLYLFEKVVGKGPNPKLQRVLHCGDFRACKAHVEHPLLRPDVQDAVSGKKRDQKIDVCYLDTTYLNPKYAFPSQENVIQACADMCVSLSKVRTDSSDGWETMKRERAGAGMVKFVKRESEEVLIKQEDEEEVKPDLDAMSVMKRANEKHRGRLLVVVGTYSIGKERICLGIARALRSKIFAPAGKQRIVRALEDPELQALMTNDPTEAQVHMTPLFEIRAETLDDYLKDYKDHFARAVGFRPSGWNYRPPNSRFTESPNVSTVLHSDNWKSGYSMKDLVPQRGSTSRASCFGVPYSEHSSFRELTMFCCALRIEKIIPTVNIGSAKSREKMKGWCEKWTMERKKNGLFKLKEGQEW